MAFYQYDPAAGSNRLQAGNHQDAMIITVAAHTILDGFTGRRKIFIPTTIRHIFEILIYIFKKLYNNEVLYSFIDVNQRLNRIVHDRIFTRDLCLLKYCPIDDSTFPLPDPILDQFCSKILPEIGHQIETLYLERTSIEPVLRATNYPNLNNLGLCDINFDLAVNMFGGKRFSLIDFIVELISDWKTK